MKPWECPRCHRINAPWAAQCTCSAEQQPSGQQQAQTGLDRLRQHLTEQGITLETSVVDLEVP